MIAPIVTIEPITVSIDKAAEVSSLCRRTICTLIERGEIETSKVGRRRLVVYASLRAYLLRGTNGQATGAR